MTPETLLAFIGIHIAGSFSPGPNNVMLASSGATFGFRATLGHILGVTLGFGAMLFLVALGFGQVLEWLPALKTVMFWASVLLFVWIAWRIATAAAPGRTAGARKPFTFWQAAGFQWVNPKAWAMCTAFAAQFLDTGAPVVSALVLTAISIVITAVDTSVWALGGTVLRRWLTTPARLHVFNFSMAAVILAGVVVAVWSGLTR